MINIGNEQTRIAHGCYVFHQIHKNSGISVHIHNLHAAIERLHILDLILKLYIFLPFLYELYPYDGQNGTQSSKSNGKDNKSEYNFIMSCRYLNIVKKSEENFLVSRKFTSRYNIKIYGKIYVIFIEPCMKRDLFSCIKGK